MQTKDGPPASRDRGRLRVGGNVVDAHNAARVGEPDAAVEEQQVIEGEGAADEGIGVGGALSGRWVHRRHGSEDNGRYDSSRRRH